MESLIEASKVGFAKAKGDIDWITDDKKYVK
jgi:hypothetical protein